MEEAAGLGALGAFGWVMGFLSGCVLWLLAFSCSCPAASDARAWRDDRCPQSLNHPVSVHLLAPLRHTASARPAVGRCVQRLRRCSAGGVGGRGNARMQPLVHGGAHGRPLPVACCSSRRLCRHHPAVSSPVRPAPRGSERGGGVASQRLLRAGEPLAKARGVRLVAPQVSAGEGSCKKNVHHQIT